MPTIDILLNDLEDAVVSSPTAPFSSSKKMVSVEPVLDIIADMRNQLPVEIKHARAVVAERNEIKENAKMEAEEIIRSAEERAKKLIENHSITTQAIEKAKGILTEATETAKKIKREASLKAEETTDSANEKARQMMQQAMQYSTALRQSSFDFAEETLRNTEQALTGALADVKATRQAVINNANAPENKESIK